MQGSARILRSSPPWGGVGAGGGFRSQGRAQGPVGNTLSPARPASQPELSGSQGTSGGEEEGAGNHSLLQPALN